MPSIESLGPPLVYKLDRTPEGANGALRVRTELRALEGMQKEALVHTPTGSWRMVCDEGPYLEGSDLAPFPLGYYAAGVVFSYMAEVQRHAAALDVDVEALDVVTDHTYSMEGSALRGDMVGGARPIRMDVRLASRAAEGMRRRVAELALRTSPAEAYMRDSLANVFSLTSNGHPVTLADLAPAAAGADDPADAFASVPRADGSAFLDEIIRKTEPLAARDGGVGTSLKAEQSRTLHQRAKGRWISGTRKEVRVRPTRPNGSTYAFVSEEGYNAKAPPGIAYLAAGAGFCFMTQVGRYAKITRRALKTFGVVQESVFHPGLPGQEHAAVAEPVATHLFLTLDEDDDAARKIARMSERTCFLHAAMRGIFPTELHVQG